MRYLNLLQIPNWKKNSFRGNYMRKYGTCDFVNLLNWLKTQIWVKWVSQFYRKIQSQGEKSNNLAMEDNKCLSKTGKTEIQPQPNRLFSLTATSTTTAPTSTAGRNQVFSLECCLRNHPCITSEKDWVGGSNCQLISL